MDNTEDQLQHKFLLQQTMMMNMLMNLVHYVMNQHLFSVRLIENFLQL